MARMPLRDFASGVRFAIQIAKRSGKTSTFDALNYCRILISRQ
jgi:hypothetical protein